jgi:hypothetical protein
MLRQTSIAVCSNSKKPVMLISKGIAMKKLNRIPLRLSFSSMTRWNIFYKDSNDKCWKFCIEHFPDILNVIPKIMWVTFYEATREECMEYEYFLVEKFEPFYGEINTFIADTRWSRDKDANFSDFYSDVAKKIRKLLNLPKPTVDKPNYYVFNIEHKGDLS